MKNKTLRAICAALMCAILCSACSGAVSPSSEAGTTGGETDVSSAAATVPVAAETTPAVTEAAPAVTVPAETEPLSSRTDTGTGPLTRGTPLYLALGDDHLAHLKEELPRSVAVVTDQDGGRRTVQTADDTTIRSFTDRFLNLSIGAPAPAAASESYNSLMFYWEDGASSFVSLNGDCLEYSRDGDWYYYELDGFEEFWNYASDLSAHISDPSEDYQVATSTAQRFSTLCFPEAAVDWDDEDGLYIGLDGSKTIPYVLIYRFANMSIGAKQYLTEKVVSNMKNRYGDDLLEIGELQEIEDEDRIFYAILFRYRAGGSVISSMRVSANYGTDVVSFNGKFTEESEDITLEALEIAMAGFHIDGPMPKAEPATTPPETEAKTEQYKGVTKTAGKAASVKLVPYSDAWVSLQIPEGWVVDVGYGKMDFFMYYALTAYDPADPDCRLFFNLKTDGYLATEAMRTWYARRYPDSPFAVLPFIDPETEENFYNHFTEGLTWFFGDSMSIPQISGFTTVEELGRNLTGGRILRATCQNESGETVDGVYTVTLLENYMDFMTLLTAYQTVFFTAPENELTDWAPVLDQCLASIAFTEDFVSCYYRSQDLVMSSIRANQAVFEETSSMIMDSWEKRSTSYDILSQKRSDATMGYERVYDTTTHEIYKAKNGFMDRYRGTDFAPVTDDMYLLPTAGYIE